MGEDGMFGSALYYPHVDISSPRWLRSAILLWDEIQTIAPTEISHPYKNPDSLICEKERYLQPLRCDLYPDLLAELGRRVLALSEQPDWLGRLRRREAQKSPNTQLLGHHDEINNLVNRVIESSHLHSDKLSPELREKLLMLGLVRLHVDKVPPALRKAIAELEPDSILDGIDGRAAASFQRARQRHQDHGWLLVDVHFADSYLAALAAMLAKEVDLSPLTNESFYQGVNLRCLLDDVVASGPSDAKGALITLVMEGLCIDPDVRIHKLISFRRSKATQLAELAAAFDDLKSKIEKGENKREMREGAKRVYENNVLPGLKKLKSELADQGIQSAWEGFYQAATVSVAAGSALAKFTDAAPTMLLGLGVSLTVTNVAVKSIYARRKARAASPYTYLLDAHRKFSDGPGAY